MAIAMKRIRRRRAAPLPGPHDPHMCVHKGKLPGRGGQRRSIRSRYASRTMAIIITINMIVQHMYQTAFDGRGVRRKQTNRQRTDAHLPSELGGRPKTASEKELLQDNGGEERRRREVTERKHIQKFAQCSVGCSVHFISLRILSRTTTGCHDASS